MKNVWLLTTVVTLYGIANGSLVNATPQASLRLGLTSADLGLIGAGIPIGYALSCLLLGRVLANVPGKYVLLCGVLGSILSMLGMALAKTAGGCTAAQISFGISAGAFWPFASAWLLDHESEGIGATRLLRHYNVAWTSGTATGLFTSGQLCKRGWITETILGAAALCGVVFVLALLARKTVPAGTQQNAGAEPAQRLARLSWMILAAACLANFAALGTRSVILNNYAELNLVRGFDADRMGLLTALTIAAQLAAFGLGRMYEPWLGCRRLYFVIVAGLVAINLGFAYSASLVVLIPCVILHGFLLAIAFQKGMLAATGTFAQARSGTTFHEAAVGIAGITPLAAGAFVAELKARGVSAEAALQAPFLVLTGFALVALAVQLVLIARRPEQRRLLR